MDPYLSEILTPSGQTGPKAQAYQRAVEAIGHALLGACVPALALWLAGDWWTAAAAYLVIALRVGLAGLYWLAKEAGDLRRGGRLADGLTDTGMVWVGTLYGPGWWPLAVMALAGAVFWWEGRR